MLVKQELYCHACDKYVIFDIDIEQDGHYTIPCPNCGHEHYRVVKNGCITSTRWASSATIYVTWASALASSSASTGDSYYWINSGTTSATYI